MTNIQELVLVKMQALSTEQQQSVLQFIDQISSSDQAIQEWESIIETAELMKVPNLLQQIETARAEYEKGDTLSMEQIFG